MKKYDILKLYQPAESRPLKTLRNRDLTKNNIIDTIEA